MNERQYDRMVGTIVYGLQTLMVLVAILIPAIFTVHGSILSRILGTRMANPHGYYLFELLYAEWLLALLLCLFLNFKERRIFTTVNSEYLRRIGLLIICKDFIYIPFDLAMNQNISLKFSIMAWLSGYIVILLSNLFAREDVQAGQPKIRQVGLPGFAACIISLIACIVISPKSFFIDWSGAESGYLNQYCSGENSKHDELQSENDDVLTLDGDEFKNLKSNVSEKKAETIKEFTLTYICNDKFREKQQEMDEQQPKGTRIPLELSKLAYLSNLQKLTIEPMSETYFGDHEDAYYYYTVDGKSLKKLRGLKELSMEYMNIKDLSFLRELPVERLTLKNCNFSDATKETYAMLAGLSSLSLEGECIGVDLKTILQETKNLVSLTIEEVQVTDRNTFKNLQSPEKLEKLSFVVTKKDPAFYESFLRPLTKLRELDIRFNTEIEEDEIYQKAYELPILGTLTSLEHLSIQGDRYRNELNGTFELENGSTLERTTPSNPYTKEVDKQNFRDYSYLGSLKSLKSLKMEHTELTDLSFLPELTNLTSLSIAYNFVNDISAIGSLSRLEELDLSYNYIQKIEPLSGLTNIKKLCIGNNKITSIEPVRNMTKLESFDASSGFYYYEDRNYSADVIIEAFYNEKPIERVDVKRVEYGYNPNCMEDVKESYLYYPGAYEGSGIPFSYENVENWENPSAQGYVTLRDYIEATIWAANKNSIEDLSPLEDKTGLVFLDISGNKVKDLTSIQGLQKLQFLSCMSNKISELGMLHPEDFPELSFLYLSQNEITDGSVITEFLEKGREQLLLQFYMTPYYNKKYLEIMEPRVSRLHVQGGIMDFINILANIGTREGDAYAD